MDHARGVRPMASRSEAADLSSASFTIRIGEQALDESLREQSLAKR
jgi:hypothetical protein